MRACAIVDPVSGAVAFVSVLIDADVVEIADFDDDPDYWPAVSWLSPS